MFTVCHDPGEARYRVGQVQGNDPTLDDSIQMTVPSSRPHILVEELGNSASLMCCYNSSLLPLAFNNKPNFNQSSRTYFTPHNVFPHRPPVH